MARPEKVYQQLRISPVLREELKQFATEDLKSVNMLVAEILEEYARKRRTKKKPR